MVERKKAKGKKAENESIAEKHVSDLKKDPNYAANFTKDPNGGGNRFAKGNKIGKLSKKGYTLGDLVKAMRQYEKERGISFLEIYLDKVLKDNRLMDSLMNRFIAQKSETTVTGGLELSINIQKKYTDGKEEN